MKEEAVANETVKIAGPELPPKHTPATVSLNTIRNEGTASLTAKVLAEQDDRNKRRKMVPNENLRTLFSSSDRKAGKQSDFMTRGFAIPAEAKR